MNERIHQLEQRIKELTRDSQELEETLNDTINAQEEMIQKENEYKKRIKELTVQLKHFQDQGDASKHLIEENKKLKDVIYWLNEDLDDMKKKINANQGIKAQYDELLQEQANLRTSLVNSAKNEEKLKRNENILENQISQLRMENSQLKEKAEINLQKMMNMVDLEVVRQIEVEKELLKKNLEKMELKDKGGLKEIQELKQKYQEEISKVIEECDEQILIHVEALEIEKERYESKLKSFRENENQGREVEELKKRCQDLEEKNRELLLTINDFERKIKDKEIKEIELSETVEKLLVEKELEDEVKQTLENQISEIENEKSCKDEKIRELSTSLKAIVEENQPFDALVKAFNELDQGTSEDKTENFESLENKVSKGLEEWFFEEKEAILEDYRVKNENLTKELARANEIISELREKEVVYNSQIEELQEDLENCVKKEDYEILQKKLVSLESINKLLKRDLDEVLDEFEKMHQEHEKRIKRLLKIKDHNLGVIDLDYSFVGGRQTQKLNEKNIENTREEVQTFVARSEEVD